MILEVSSARNLIKGDWYFFIKKCTNRLSVTTVRQLTPRSKLWLRSREIQCPERGWWTGESHCRGRWSVRAEVRNQGRTRVPTSGASLRKSYFRVRPMSEKLGSLSKKLSKVQACPKIFRTLIMGIMLTCDINSR